MPDTAHVFLTASNVPADPALVTQALGLTPTEQWAADQARIATPRVIRRTSGWRLHSPLPRTVPVEEHLEALLEVLEPQTAAIKAATPEYRLGLVCALYYQDAQPGIRFSPATLAKLSALGLSLDLEFYFLGPSSDQEDS